MVNDVSISGYSIRQCKRADCSLRYPIVNGQLFGFSCPNCGSETKEVLAKALYPEPEDNPISRMRYEIDTLLDNVRSAWNVGSILRSAEGLGVCHLYLCGITPTPENTKVTKTSLGAEKKLSWSKHTNGVNTAIELKKKGRCLWALERDERSIAIQQLLDLRNEKPIVLVVGNEISGVDPGILELCEQTVHIPMAGQKRSFNVAVAYGIAVYTIMFG